MQAASETCSDGDGDGDPQVLCRSTDGTQSTRHIHRL